MNSQDDIHLWYFQGNGKATLIRAILFLGGVKYTDHALTFEEWAKLEKPVSTFEYGYMPVLTINGKAYSQSIAIANYLGKKLGFFGSNAEEEYEILNIILTFDEFSSPIITSEFMQDPEAKKKKLQELNEHYLTWMLPIYENKVANRKGKYVVGDKLSVADVFLAHTLDLLKYRNEYFSENIKKYASKLNAYVDDLWANDLKVFRESGKYYQGTPF